MCLGSGYLENTAFLRVEVHSPLFFSRNKFVEIILESFWSCNNVTSLYRMQSSANILVLELRSSGRSLIKIRNNAGPRTEP